MSRQYSLLRGKQVVCAFELSCLSIKSRFVLSCCLSEAFVVFFEDDIGGAGLAFTVIVEDVKAKYCHMG